MEGFAAIARELSALLGDTCASEPEQRIAGGSVTACYRWSASRRLLFVKVAARASAPAFAAEAEGLSELAAARAVRVPQVRAHGHTDRAAFLALEWIEAGIASGECERRLGEGLAALHEVTAERFGWKCDNTIGRTPQANGWLADWTEFFRERRLRPQLDLAIENGFAGALGDRGEQLLERLPALLSGHAPRASLLHGDLWRGNWLVCAQGHPVIFDPAVYFGDRETDLAMTRLFGGFGAGFYRAYEAAAPLPTGAHERAELYNLYHVLNHANLFGGGYARQARAIIDRLLAQLQA
ncbi:MAG: fructosamine kinase family protein [Gammaproteobacteria bacterium]|nr:fructosamine kinase family protein [Gammaproteobacteria bacterium]